MPPWVSCFWDGSEIPLLLSASALWKPYSADRAVLRTLIPIMLLNPPLDDSFIPSLRTRQIRLKIHASAESSVVLVISLDAHGRGFPL